jgi:carboxypeptidase Q
MRIRHLLITPFLLIGATLTTLHAQPTLDQAMVERIKKEGMENSQIMEYAVMLTDVYGPRLTNSPQMRRATDYTKKVFEQMGLENVHLHEWGPFGVGWELKRFALHATSPYTYFPVLGYPKAWSPGYSRPMTGEVVILKGNSEAELAKYKGKLAGKFVMIEEPVKPEPGWEPIARRNSDERLLGLANATRQPTRANQANTPNAGMLARAQAAYQKAQFLTDEKPIAILDQSYRGWAGQVAISGATLPADPSVPWAERPRPYQVDAPTPIPQISLAREHYGRMYRLTERGIPVTMEMDFRAEFHRSNLNAQNTIAEIKGTDPELADQIVILGGHLDSWHTGTGATDNASGSIVMMEVMRILKALDVKPRRTIRVALWDGEEQGLFGSSRYVSDMFGTVENGAIVKKADYDNFSAYYNIDNGTGQVRGIYLQENEQLRELFRTWLTPFAEWNASTVSFSNTGGTDHQSFDRIGLPGFQFIQDPMEYSTLTHHSNMDTYERLVEEDLKRTAVIVATFVYHTAMMDERLPRK